MIYTDGNNLNRIYLNGRSLKSIYYMGKCIYPAYGSPEPGPGPGPGPTPTPTPTPKEFPTFEKFTLWFYAGDVYAKLTDAENISFIKTVGLKDDEGEWLLFDGTHTTSHIPFNEGTDPRLPTGASWRATRYILNKLYGESIGDTFDTQSEYYYKLNSDTLYEKIAVIDTRNYNIVIDNKQYPAIPPTPAYLAAFRFNPNWSNILLMSNKYSSVQFSKYEQGNFDGSESGTLYLSNQDTSLTNEALTHTGIFPYSEANIGRDYTLELEFTNIVVSPVNSSEHCIFSIGMPSSTSGYENSMSLFQASRSLSCYMSGARIPINLSGFNKTDTRTFKLIIRRMGLGYAVDTYTDGKLTSSNVDMYWGTLTDYNDAELSVGCSHTFDGQLTCPLSFHVNYLKFQFTDKIYSDGFLVHPTSASNWDYIYPDYNDTEREVLTPLYPGSSANNSRNYELEFSIYGPFEYSETRMVLLTYGVVSILADTSNDSILFSCECADGEHREYTLCSGLNSYTEECPAVVRVYKYNSAFNLCVRVNDTDTNIQFMPYNSIYSTSPIKLGFSESTNTPSFGIKYFKFRWQD